LLAVTIFRGFFVKMGFIRYMIMSSLMLLMLTLPLKMILRLDPEPEIHREHPGILAQF